MLNAQQLVQRAVGIGASEAAAACGLSKYKTPVELYLEKVAAADGQPLKRDDENEQARLRMAGGSALEPIIIGEFERRTKLQVTDRGVQVLDPVHSWRWVTLDGRTADQSLVEAKKTEITGAEWGEGDEDIPDDYYCQAQHGMACTAAQRVYVPVLLPRWEFALYVVTRDQEFIDLMTSQELAFMDFLRQRTPPPVMELSDAKRLWPKHKPLKAVTLDPSIVDVAQQLANLKARLKADEAKKEMLELQIKVAMGDAEEAIGRGGRVATWKNNKASLVFDEDQFAIDHPGLWQKYRIERPGPRVFLLKTKANAE